MARRKENHGEELPFVALMDTMTNVVGVLIIVLVMIGIGLAEASRKVISDLPQVTQEEFDKLKKEVAEVKPKEDPQKVEEDTVKLQEQLKRAVEDLKTLDLTKEAQKAKLLQIEELTRQLEAKRKERDDRKGQVEKLLAEVEAMKARLDKTPVYQPPPATVVKLPNPRPMPDKAVVHRFLVANSRIIYLNDEEFSKLASQEIDRNSRTLILSNEVVKGPDGKPVMVKDRFGRLLQQRKTVYDAKKLSEYFSKQRLGSREVKVEVAPLPNSPRVGMKITPAPDAGETVQQIRNAASNYQTVLKKLKTGPANVVWFYVFKDSIETYLNARDIADQLGLPVGWELYGSNFYARALPPEYAVNFTPPKPAATTTAPTVTITPPKTTLD